MSGKKQSVAPLRASFGTDILPGGAGGKPARKLSRAEAKVATRAQTAEQIAAFTPPITPPAVVSFGGPTSGQPSPYTQATPVTPPASYAQPSPFAEVTAAPAAPAYPIGYPTAPGFPQQPAYADAALLASPSSSPAATTGPAQAAPTAPSMPPPAPPAPPFAPPMPYMGPGQLPAAGFGPASYQPAFGSGLAQPGSIAGGYPPPSGYPQFPLAAPQGQSTGNKVVLGVAVGVVAVVALMILAAIAIPVFVSQQKAVNRNVSLPATLVDQQQVSSPDLADTAARLTAAMTSVDNAWSTPTTAFYGPDGQPLFVVSAAKLNQRPTSSDEASFFASVRSHATFTMAAVGAGPFGGRMECGSGTLNTALTECYSIDDAAVVSVLVLGSTDTDQGAILTRQVIAGVEH